MSLQFVNRVLELTNVERAKAGLKPLALDNQLTQAAQGHSDSMAVDDFFSHTGADGSSVGDRVRDTDYNFSRTGENIAVGQRTPEQVVEGWMNSPGHRANILNANYTEIGIGYEYLQNDTGSVNYNHYWTQVFGTPQGGGRNVTPSEPTTLEVNNDNVTPSEPTTLEVDNDPVPVSNRGNDVPELNSEDGSQFANRVVELTNAERAKAGLESLTLNNQLIQAAQGHSDSMAVDDFFSHTGADGSSVGDRVRDTGYKFATAGENIAAGQRTAADVVEGWMNSPGHRANILNANYTEIGVGYELLENDTGSVNYNRYWTQVFGSQQGGGTTPVTNSQPTETVKQNNKSIAVEDNKGDTSLETDSNPVDSLQPKISSKDSKVPQTIEIELVETELTTTENEQDSQIETLDNNPTNSKSADKNNDSLDKGDDFTLFGADMGMSGDDVYSDDLTGSSDSGVMTSSDDAIISSKPKAYSYSVSYSNGGEEFDFTTNNHDFADIAEMMKKSWLGSSESSMNQYESDLIDAISNSDLSSGQQQEMIETVESLF